MSMLDPYKACTNYVFVLHMPVSVGMKEMVPNPTLLTSFIHSDSIFYMIIIVIPYFRVRGNGGKSKNVL